MLKAIIRPGDIGVFQYRSSDEVSTRHGRIEDITFFVERNESLVNEEIESVSDLAVVQIRGVFL